MPIKTFTCFLVDFFLKCRSSLYTLNTNPLSEVWFANISSHLWIAFSLIDCVLWCIEGLNFYKVQFTYFFSSVARTFCVILKKSLSNLMLCRFYSTCSSQSFTVVFVMLRSWSFWISLCMLCKIRVQLYSFAGGYPVFPLPLVENAVFHHWMVLAPLSKPFDHMWPQRQRLAW